jgi:hypothetical protein
MSHAEAHAWTGALRRAVKVYVEGTLRRPSDLRLEQRLADAVAPRASAVVAHVVAHAGGLEDLIAWRGDLLTLLLDPLLAASTGPVATTAAAATASVPPAESPSSSGMATATAAALQETVQLLGRFLLPDEPLRERRKGQATASASASAAAAASGIEPTGLDEREPVNAPALAAALARRVAPPAAAALAATMDGDTVAQLQRLDRVLLRAVQAHMGPGHLRLVPVTYGSDPPNSAR